MIRIQFEDPTFKGRSTEITICGRPGMYEHEVFEHIPWGSFGSMRMKLPHLSAGEVNLQYVVDLLMDYDNGEADEFLRPLIGEEAMDDAWKRYRARHG